MSKDRSFFNRLGTALDHAIAVISPGWTKSRVSNRAGGYLGASYQRPALVGWKPTSGDANDAASSDLPTLRERSRDLERNTPIACGAINTSVTHVIGSGLTLQSVIDYEYLGISEEEATVRQNAIEQRFRLWAESKDCDVTRTQTFYGLQNLAFRSMLVSGDVFTLLPIVTRSVLGDALAVQIIEADRVCNPNYGTDTAIRVSGIDLDEHGAPIRYHICRKHPQSFRRDDQLIWDAREAFGATTGRRNVHHLFERKRPGQVRGVPYLAVVIEPLKQLSRYTDAELQAAVITAAFAIFFKMDPAAFDDMLTDDGKEAYIKAAQKWDGTFPGSTLDGPGKAVNLLPGEEPVAVSQTRPNAEFDPFFQAVVRQIGVALEIPFEVLIKHFTASYSASRAALLDFWRVVRCRREFFADHWCQPIYEEWFAWEVANGRERAPGFFVDPAIRAAYTGAIWIGDGSGSLNPKDEMDAAEMAIGLGISTVARESILYDGVDWQTKHRQRVREVQARQSGGVDVAPVRQKSSDYATRPIDTAN
jgi:lambda family phage portal protein